MKAWSNSDTQKNGGFVPEKKLLVAVLQRAVTDFVTGDDEMKSEAFNWIMDSKMEDEERPLTFIYICEALDFEPDNLRKAIKLHAQAQGVSEFPVLKKAV